MANTQEISAATGYGRPWADAHEIDSFDRFVADFHAGRLGADDFKRFRLQHGIYGQRQPDTQMVRVKIPWGGLTADQIDRLADLAARTPRGVGHVTTRQNFQFHFVPLDDVPDTMRTLGDVGLTTREACGNTVRNVTVGHCAGVCAHEAFDPTPYADALARFLLRNPMNQNLPRKFKIAFSGCADDTGLTAIHDIGARAVVRTVDGLAVRGFTILLGGGLGPAPQLAQPLEDFTPAGDLIATVAAIVRVFDRQGNRENRNLARLKFVVKKLGIEAVRTLVVKEREALRLVLAGTLPAITPWEETAPPVRPSNGASAPSRDPAFTRWRATNVAAQKQTGYVTVHVRLVRGDVTAPQLRAVAEIARDFAEATVRATNQQNLVVRWIPVSAVAAVYHTLRAVDLVAPGAERLVDVTTCPGADTCQLGITSSRGLALAISDAIERELGGLADESGLRVKISGCPNSCGQHHLASLGLYGGSRKFHGEAAPTYQLLVGGRTGSETRYGRPLARIPARLAPSAVKALLEAYRDERGTGESFDAFTDRVGMERLAQIVAPFTELAPSAEAPGHYVDWEASARFVPETGAGECAA
ncbi:MAG: nitrite/sulfite reductase [Candidatus Rokubacteria bacterium]|nr:nitrite/sulfite reductase [Candidatus Rokubacteria bacterium]